MSAPGVLLFIRQTSQVEVVAHSTHAAHASLVGSAAHVRSPSRVGRTACRVVVKGPGEHHRTGGPYEVNIHLALPNGREVDIDRTRQEFHVTGRTLNGFRFPTPTGKAQFHPVTLPVRLAG